MSRVIRCRWNGGIGKKVTPVLELGVVGYDQWQVSKDKGTGATDDKFSKHAVGVEGSYMSKALRGIVEAAYYDEYDVQAGSGLTLRAARSGLIL